MKNFHFITMVVGIMLLVFVWNNYSAASANSKSISYQTISVKPGDSVWSIAANFTTPKDDIRNVIIDIKKINGLSNDVAIYPGQILKIPVKVTNTIIETNDVRVTKAR
ncbi:MULTISPECIES: LysM domain-containing protein [Sporomusa]|jgi:LysM repeat protein|uniref:LysM peptidoglycan-binding domain-containing protein n=1 Tax=Sporomusa TaxID=2375 RepID=UPI00166B610E|nr:MULTISPECIES: LysM domain-containing protein [Sporomusa]MCM0757186.1 LysM peptidoglycan-binding domain-containing protein [Sporomusa sphaeroides DSM 2875]HML34356.1 LysM domain-containing protein [Sporomusa sphaeroides]